MRLVLTGATGFLGRPLVQQLLGAGHEIALLTRHPRGIPDVREHTWQPDGSVGPWSAVLEGADAVVHLAGESIAGKRWTPARKAAIVESRLKSTHSLVAALEQIAARPRVLVSASAVGYYGARGAEGLTEDARAGDDFLARLCVDWEQAASRAEALGIRVVLLRNGLVLERDGGALAQMLLPFRLGVGGPLGSGAQYWSWIHRDDWIALVEFLLAQPRVAGPVNATAPQPETNEIFSRTLARVLRRPCLFRVPAFALELALGELAEALLTGQRALPARAEGLGFRFAYPALEPALSAIVSSDASRTAAA